MKVTILPSSPTNPEFQHLTTFLINGRIAIDAGCLGFWGEPEVQAAVTSVFLSHSHADHVCSLPMFAMNVLDYAGQNVVVRAPQTVLDCLRTDVFNGRLWPDFTALRNNGVPFVQLEPVEPGQPVSVDGLTVTAIPVEHPVPNVAYLVEDGLASVLFCVDTGPTSEVWEIAIRRPTLKGVFVDAALPNDLHDLAVASGHLTPALLAKQIESLPGHVKVLACHLKPAHHRVIAEQISRLARGNVEVGRPGVCYVF